jgi:hypothetical protein
MKQLAMIAAVGLAACASVPPSRPDYTRRHVLRGEVLHRAGAADLFTSVRTHRPEWLRIRQQTISGNEGVVVYFGHLRLGGVEMLRDMPVSHVKEAVYLTPAAAQFRFGAGHLNGAILLTPN